MNTNFLHLTIELTVGFMALILVTKILGKTQITQLTPFYFISALILGELLGNAIYDKEIGLKYVLYALTLWATLIFAIELLTQKFKGTRSLLEGKPSIVIRDGYIDFQELKKNRLDINQLQILLRKKDVFSVREVAYAILESDGSVSVMKKSMYDSTTKQDINAAPKPVFLPTTVISDGEILYDNLAEAGYSEDWLRSELNNLGIVNVKQVFYAEWLEGDSLFINSYR
ncbi:DUF421 domain-containing protein [Halalkalibacter akibai]|uniref:DUF421 domain-containing protein n=1 Tax=Halalkalibacter akibai (strain ATCC 43226 / DSM 21942 / CIP 109018 / JCM 9157 / 1139) TaxID=1236973 RepID=W4R033_HALA3|nr:hypothetical protein JCM9157_4550 [Halalkalibacter akibai JCM 9157]